MRQISRVSHLEPFRARSDKIMKSTGFSCEKIYLKENRTNRKTCVGDSRAA